MNGLTRRWSFGDAAPHGSGDVPTSLLMRLLAARGLHDPEAARGFCDPRLTDLHSPALLPGVDRAAERILAALAAGEMIAIYGDYDVDGITATAILFRTLRAIAPDARLRCYVPHRIDEGYGLNEDALRQLRGEGATLVISVDCGVTACGPAKVAREIGLDLIITDHHHAPSDAADLPCALAIVHPALPGPEADYPFADLCGAGVAFKLAWRIATLHCGSERVSDALRGTLMETLPLVALGTIADVVPLHGENRVLVSTGLRAIRSTQIIGLRALIDASGLGGADVDSEKVGFVLAPRLNACGRLGHAADAVRLLTDATREEAAEIAARLTALNRERQATESAIVAQARELAERTGQTAPHHRAIVLAHDEWHAGVVGIACSRLVDRYGRPTVLLQRSGDLCKGSARSVPGYSIHAGLSSCRDLLESFGGHEAAAGLSVRSDRVEALGAALVEHANAHLDEKDLIPSLRIDCAAALGELDLAAVRAIGRLAPFGRGNPRPSLLLRDVTVAAAPRTLKEQHLKLAFKHAGPGREIEAIWFNGAMHRSSLERGRTLDVVVEPKISSWSGRVEVEIRDVSPLGSPAARLSEPAVA